MSGSDGKTRCADRSAGTRFVRLHFVGKPARVIGVWGAARVTHFASHNGPSAHRVEPVLSLKNYFAVEITRHEVLFVSTGTAPSWAALKLKIEVERLDPKPLVGKQANASQAAVLKRLGVEPPGPDLTRPAAAGPSSPAATAARASRAAARGSPKSRRCGNPRSRRPTLGDLADRERRGRRHQPAEVVAETRARAAQARREKLRQINRVHRETPKAARSPSAESSSRYR